MDLNERREMIKDVIRHDMKAYSKDQLYSELFDFLVDDYDQGIHTDEESLIDHWEEATGKTYALPDKNAEWENNGFASEADFWKYKEG
jgi:hypothetical protein